MADDAIREEEEVLQAELDKLNEQTAKLAEKFEALAGIDCDFGECIFDPEMDSVEKKLAEIQRRKKVLEGMIEHLESCEK
jgi:chaperonin cofactor prefoldin